MNTIDYVYRFDPKNPSVKPPPPDAEAARRTLEDGNRMFALDGELPDEHVSQRRAAVRRAVQRPGGGDEPRTWARCPSRRRSPWSSGCSDARVPTEMLFGQGFNDLFVIRVAGNVLGDVCMGSIEFALNALQRERQLVVVIWVISAAAP